MTPPSRADFGLPVTSRWLKAGRDNHVMLLKRDQGQASRDAGFPLISTVLGEALATRDSSVPAARYFGRWTKWSTGCTVTFAVISNSAGVPGWGTRR